MEQDPIPGAQTCVSHEAPGVVSSKVFDTVCKLLCSQISPRLEGGSL